VHFLSLIEAKRDGKSLTSEQIKEMIAAYARREVPDYQMAAFLMAVFFRGLDKTETRDLTLAMRDSGDQLTFPKDRRPLVDKHSTGGVGDKVSLPLAPLLACLGFRVPMISGRGLGITGGTLDKLDSIPGIMTTLPPSKIIQIVQSVGCIICGQTDRMVPADKALYSLRDVTGTVASIPLIVASILSKKLAEGLDALVLDVKFGAAAFMPSLPKARELANAMVELGNACGVRTRAMLTRMDEPLGRAAGNWLEVKEAVDCLEDRGPADLRYLVLECAAQLLVSARKCKTIKAGREQAASCLSSGEPRTKWNAMLKAQGADLTAFENKLRKPSEAVFVTDIIARSAGRVSRCDARIIGEVVRDLGGGRQTKESVLNYEVGIEIFAKPGSIIQKGEPLARLYAASAQEVKSVAQRVVEAFTVSSGSKASPKLLADVIY
jgi:pyrimidine-nucleoside phosphorylase